VYGRASQSCNVVADMSDLRVIEDVDSGECVYVHCGIAFGPVMKTREQADKFHEWLGISPRLVESLRLIAQYKQFQAECVCRYCGEIRPDFATYEEPTMKGYRHSCYQCDLGSMESARDTAMGL
jgi:hypothetical protein